MKLFLVFLLLPLFVVSSFAIRFPNPQDPQRELRECIQDCRREHGSRQGQCEQECRREFQGRRGERRGRWSEDYDELIEAMINPYRRDPESRQYEECRRDCQRQGQRGEGQEWQCERRCQERYQGHRRGGQWDDEVEEENQGGRDPRKSLEQCKQACRRIRAGREVQEACMRSCEDEFQQERGRGGRYVDEVDDSEYPYGRDPYRQCQHICERQGGGYQCQRRCQEAIRGGGYVEESEYPRRQDPYRVCQQVCQRQGDREKCQRRCQEAIQGGGSRYVEEESEFPRRQDPYRVCQQVCHRQGDRQECQRRCQEAIRGGGGRYLEEESENYRHDQYRECKQRCQRRGEGYECERRCERQFQRDNESPRQDPQRQRRFQECQQRCQRQGQGMECQQRCQREYQRERGMSEHPTLLASFLELTGLF